MIVTDAQGRYLCHRRSLKPSALVFRYTTGGMTASTFQRALVFQKRGIRFEDQWRIIADKVWYHTLIQAGVGFGCHNHLVSAFAETGSNLGWSAAVQREYQDYANRFLGGKAYGVFLFGKLNALRRIAKEWWMSPPKEYALYTPENLHLRQAFVIAKPTCSWGKRAAQPPQ